MQTHNPVIARSIPLAMAEAQRDAGRSLLRDEHMSILGLTPEEVDRHAPEAGRLFARMEQRRAA